MGPRRRRQHGVGMVEFAVSLPFLLLVIFGMVDLSRAISANSTIAEAARQGARQMAANAATGDSPFGSYAGTCSGTALTQNVTGTGCLTDTAVLATVRAVLVPVTTNVVLYAGTTAAGCAALTAPVSGEAYVCISPGEPTAAARGPNDSCSTAQTALGHYPAPGDLGGRKTEWTTPQYATGRCFLVQVTVRYAFQPWTPVMSRVMGSTVVLSSSTSTSAEY